jgi:chemotaxis methyl-accepting protein methylase
VTAIDDPEFVSLTRHISRKGGMTLGAYKDKCIRRRIAVRMRACGVHTYADYQSLLERTPHEYERLRDALTINVTRFYRNAETWHLLRRDLIPALCRQPGRDLHVWSAGCSSGEEPYTFAVLVADHLERTGRAGELDRLTIDATDIDRASLERARGGAYRPEALAEMPPELLQRYFERAGAQLQVCERVRRRVLVRTHDMSAEGPLRLRYDLILCRNVVIYFDRTTQERLFSTFGDALAPGGYLVLGKVETLFGQARDRLALVDPRERVYRRPA